MIKKINKLIEDMPIIIKLILGIIMTGIITLFLFIINVSNVSAAAMDLPQPTRMCVDGFINGQSNQTYCGNGRQVTLWNKPFWEGPTNYYQIGGYSQSDIYYSNNIQYDILGYCEGKSILISGEIAGLSNLFIDKVVNYNFVMNGNNLQCTYEQENMSLVKYTCSGIGGGNFIINLNVPSYSNNDAYEVAFSKNVNVTCDNNISDLIVANQNNTQLITNAVDNSTNTIINQMQDNLNLCENYNYTKNELFYIDGWLNNDGTISSSTTYKISDYIAVKQNQNYNVTEVTKVCYFNKEKTIISCTSYQNETVTITPQQDGYIRMVFNKGREPQFTGRYCQDRTEAEIDYYKQFISQLSHQSEWDEEDDEVKNGLLRNIISGIGNIFGFLGDDELDDPDDALSDLSSNMGTNNVISSLLLLPVSIYQSVVNNINGTCNSFNLGSLYNHNLTMTCVRPQDYLGTALWGVIDVIISGIFVLHIRKKFVDIFNHFTSLRTGGNELE